MRNFRSTVGMRLFVVTTVVFSVQWLVSMSHAALAAQPSVAASDAPDETIAALKNYRSEMLPKVLRHWSRPEQDLTSLVSFDIDGLGAVSRVAIAQSCGVPAADKAALEAVAKSSPFRALPGDIQHLSARITFSSSPSICTETPESSRLFRQAALSLDATDFPVAIAKLRRAIDIAGGDCPKYLQLISQAFVSYALFLPNDSPAVPAQLYESLLFNSNNDAARQQLNEVLEKKGINAKDCKIRLALAKKALHDRNMDMAKVELQEAKRLIGDDDATASEITDIEQLVSLYIDCDYWQKFLQKYPNSYDGHLGLALAWQQGNKPDSATAEFKKALAIKPDSSFAKLMLQAIADHLPPE